MKSCILLISLALAALPAIAQRHKLAAINAETEEGKVLQAIGTEADAARKLALMEEFAGKYPKHEAMGWVLSQMQTAYVSANNFDKAVAVGEKLVALDPMDLDAAYTNLKAAEGRKDTDAVIRWAGVTSDIARKTEALPKGEQESEETHAQLVKYAKQADVYSEYALSAAALSSQDAPKIVAATEALEKRNPQSQYLPPLIPRYAWAARQANALPSAMAFGERAMGRNQLNEDLMLLMADQYMQQKHADKTIQTSGKLIEYLSVKPKPEGVSDADWEKKKNTTLGVAWWLQGTTYAGQQGKNAEMDKAFRAALPYIKDNDQLLGPALFYLGLSNYQMGKGKNAQQIKEAIGFMQQAAAIRGPYQAKAQSNVAVMRKETGAK